MDFRYAKPIVSAREREDLITFCQTLKPEIVEASGVEQVFAIVGRFVVGGYDIPAEVRPWVDSLSRGNIILARIQAQAVICNANWATAKRVEQAIFALVGYTWLFKPLRSDAVVAL